MQPAPSPAKVAEKQQLAKFMAWAAKNLFLPLTPFITGAIIRAVSGVTDYRGVFDVGELSFSMAMLCLLVVVSAGRLTDQHLRESLVGLWILAGVVFLTFFAISTFVKVQIDAGTKDLLQNVQKALSDSSRLTDMRIPDPGVERMVKVLDRIWLFVIVPAVPTAVFAATCKFGFKLED